MSLCSFLALLALQFNSFHPFHEGYLLMREGSSPDVLPQRTCSLQPLHLIISEEQMPDAVVLWFCSDGQRGAVLASGNLLPALQC